MDLVWVYNYCSGDNVDGVTKHLDTMVEERGNYPDAENLLSNLLEVHSKMRFEVHSNMMTRVKENLTNVLAPLLQIPAPT